MKKRIVLTTFGSLGDLHPYIALGLRARGYEAAIATSSTYREKIEAFLGEQAMRWKAKPHEERKPEDYMEAADNALELAEVLAGQGGISNQDFLNRMAHSDELVDDDGETCGQCHYQILGAEVAREMIEAGEYEDVVSKWAAEHKRRWEKSKFFKLWEKEKKAGRDPRKAFEERGWKL